VPTQIDLRCAAQLIEPRIAWSKIDSLRALRQNAFVRFPQRVAKRPWPSLSRSRWKS
jgi:hypothetical protein